MSITHEFKRLRLVQQPLGHHWETSLSPLSFNPLFPVLEFPNDFDKMPVIGLDSVDDMSIMRV